MEEEISQKVLEQQESIRSSGEVNMFNVAGVQRIANMKGFNELAVFIEEHNSEEYIEMAGQSAIKLREQ